MPLEQATYIDTLQPDWPTGSDPLSAGDDHIRQIKKTLQNTFPNINGEIVATPEVLNNLAQITWRTLDENPSQYPYAGYWQADDPAGTGAAAITSANLSAAMANAVPSSVVSWEMVQNLIYPIHSVLVSTNSANPADYLGFGTWTQRPGSVYGAGGVTDGMGATWNVPAGAIAGNLRVQTGHIVGSDLPLAIDSAGDHAHSYTQYATNNDTSTEGGGAPISTTGNTTGTTGNAGAHVHTGKVTIGAGGATEGSQFVSPGYAFYVWERTA